MSILAMAESELVTVRNVEVCATGLEYPLSTGPATFTTEDLMDAVAAQDDPGVSAPRVWLGHPDDRRIHGERVGVPHPSGEPAVGKVQNLRLEQDGQVLVGDLVGVPRWLATIMASAYPARSIEGNMDVETVTGHRWRLVIHELALLGVVWPGVSTLSDIQALFSAEGPDGVEVFEAQRGEPVPVTASRAVQAGVNMDDVRRAYYEQLNGEQAWWWIRAIYLDPNELIVDDDEGGLYRVGFAVDGEEVNFEEAKSVKIQYVDAALKASQEARAVCAAMQRPGKTPGELYASRSESRPESTQEEEVVRVTASIDLGALRTRLGLTAEQLPDNATEEQINQALTSGAPAAEGQPDAGATQPTATPETAQPTPGVQPNSAQPPESEGGANSATPGSTVESEPVAAAAGMIQVPASEWARVQQGLQAATRLVERDQESERDRVISAAVSDGKIRPADRQSYVNLFAANEQAARTLLTASVEQGGLAPNLVPVHERGSNAPSENLDVSSYPSEWVPEVNAQRGSIRRRNRVTQEA